MNWYKRYLGDYRRKTARMTMLEHGAYNMLIDEYYASGEPLPDDIEQLNRICGAHNRSERKAVKTVVDQYFKLNGDGTRHNKRCDEELAKFKHISSINSAIAKARELTKSRPRTVERSVNESLNEPYHQPEVRSQIQERPSKSEPLGPLGQKALNELRPKFNPETIPVNPDHRVAGLTPLEIAEAVASGELGPQA